MFESMIDNWMSVEIFRFMHGGRLPVETDNTWKYITDFLDKSNDIKWWAKNVMVRPDWGSLYLTAKRMVYKYQEPILKELTPTT